MLDCTITSRIKSHSLKLLISTGSVRAGLPLLGTQRRRFHVGRNMTTTAKTDHAQRTAHEPRDPSLHKMTLARVDEINPTIRTYRLETPPGARSIRFLPGQWLDVFVPGIEKPGGFTITSPPSKALSLEPQADTTGGDTTSSAEPSPATNPYVELAIQKSSENVVADWLWQPAEKILSSDIWIRVGGSFVWPPPGVMPMTLRKLIFIAGGVGINPLMSIVSHLAERPNRRYTIDFLYSMRDPGEGNRDPSKMLFINRLAEIFGADGGEGRVKGELKLFLTPGDGKENEDGRLDGLDVPFKSTRTTVEDIESTIGADKRFCVVYVCGVPGMTDHFVQKLTSPTGMGLEPHRVLYEKWW